MKKLNKNATSEIKDELESLSIPCRVYLRFEQRICERFMNQKLLFIISLNQFYGVGL
jgi:hypothetical protein